MNKKLESHQDFSVKKIAVWLEIGDNLLRHCPRTGKHRKQNNPHPSPSCSADADSKSIFFKKNPKCLNYCNKKWYHEKLLLNSFDLNSHRTLALRSLKKKNTSHDLINCFKSGTITS